MDPMSEAIVCDSSMRFSGRTFIRMMIKTIRTVSANGLPTTTSDQKLRFMLKKRGFRAIGENGGGVRNIRLVSAFGDVSIF
jgi:hypothetical protein